MRASTTATDVAILTALADPIRLEMVKRLSHVREVAGAQLARELGISRALLCHHAGILVCSGLATRRKAGQTRYLRLNAARLRRCVGKLGRRTRPSGKAVTRSRAGAGAARPKPR